MRMVRPKLDAPQATVAEEQEEFKPVTAALVTHPSYSVAPGVGYNSVVMCFRPSDEERAQIADGEDLYISLLTFGGPQQGIIVQVGAEETAATYGVRQEA